ncbi:response regulator receiver protein [Fulvivirga imtechensis AK7]|uniref:Response regulator receiver protein n=1 Tax=Fulvivirga imtechensis AK7 TaxID=1237149 RepID=L8JUR3_9BACT|nr:response regulator [Fulvivirga imtechensis]ELR71978.1 response regulator receiver protein [Fulvivirga imtechensis AK7]
MEQEIEIVLIEDNPDDAALAIRALKRKNLANKVIHLNDGEEALTFFFGAAGVPGRAEEGTPRVVLLDLNMPKVSGLEVLQKLRSNTKTAGIPVIVLTSSSSDPKIKRCNELGADRYIVKPVDFRSFAETVADLGMKWIVFNHHQKV